MESSATLIRTQTGVELYAISLVHFYLVLVIFPSHAKLDHTLGNGNYAERGTVCGMFGEQRRFCQGSREFCEWVGTLGDW